MCSIVLQFISFGLFVPLSELPIDTEAEMVNKYRLGKSVDLPFAEGLMESCTAVANAKFWLNIVLPFALYRLLFLR